eukprot:COSAG01_NODE_2895_length_6901_cov_35.009262_5_plen_149_part_00
MMGAQKVWKVRESQPVLSMNGCVMSTSTRTVVSSVSVHYRGFVADWLISQVEMEASALVYFSCVTCSHRVHGSPQIPTRVIPESQRPVLLGVALSCRSVGESLQRALLRKTAMHAVRPKNYYHSMSHGRGTCCVAQPAPSGFQSQVLI